MKQFKQTSVAIIFLLLLIGASARAADWTSFRQGAARTGASDSTLATPVSVKWTFEAGGPIFSSPVSSGGLVFIGDRNNKLYAVDENSGLEKWRFQTGGWVDSTPAVSTGSVFFSSRDGFVYSLNASTGALVWKTDLGGTHCSSPLVAGNKIIVGTGYPSKQVVALDSATGNAIWKIDMPQMVYSSAALLGDTIFIGGNDGSYVALKAATGEQVWSVQTNGGIYFSTPAVSGGVVFAAPGDYDRGFYAWNAADGKPVWKYTIIGTGKISVSSAAVDGQKVFICAGYPDVKIYAFNQQTGALLWSAPAGSATQHGYLSSPAVGAEYVWVGSGDGNLYIFDKATGASKAVIALGSPILGSVALLGDKVIIGATDGSLYALW